MQTFSRVKKGSMTTFLCSQDGYRIKEKFAQARNDKERKSQSENNSHQEKYSSYRKKENNREIGTFIPKRKICANGERERKKKPKREE